MDNRQIGLLMLVLIGGAGVIILACGFLILFLEKRKKTNCTALTQGTVETYSYTNGSPLPVAVYTVDGIQYRRKRHCRAVVTVRKRKMGRIDESDTSIWMDEKDIMHVHGGAMINMREWAERMWPPGSAIAVYYNPEKPKQSYVERIPSKSSAVGWVFVWTGLGLVLLGMMIYFLFS